MNKHFLIIAGVAILSSCNPQAGNTPVANTDTTQTVGQEAASENATETAVDTTITATIQKGQKILRSHEELNEYFGSLGEFIYKEGDLEIISEENGSLKVSFSEMKRDEMDETEVTMLPPVEMIIPITKAKFFICNEDMSEAGLGNIEVSRDDMPMQYVRIYLHEGENEILCVRECIAG